MPRKIKQPPARTVEALRHRPEDATRKNIPTAEYQPVLEQETQDPVRVAYERRNRDLDPQLVWRGKDEQDWSDLVVHAPPLYIQEKILPKALIDDLLRQTQESRQDDENVHRVRAVMDEVFGEENSVSQIGFAKTSGSTDDYLGQTTDYLLWYAKDTQRVKFRAALACSAWTRTTS